MSETFLSTGRCLCGSVTFELSGSPNKVGACHCRQCQRWSGSVFAVGARFPESAFKLTSGEMKVYRQEIMERGFCSKCGSPFIYWYLAEEMAAGNVWISLGTLDEPEQFKPTYHYAVETEMSWLHEELPRMRLDECESFAAALKNADPEN